MFQAIKNYLKSLYLKIQKSNDMKYLDKIEQLEKTINEKDIKIKSLSDNISELGLIYYSKEQELNAIIESLKDEPVEKPTWMTGHMLYKPRRRFISKTKDLHRQFSKPQHAFDKSTYLYELLKKNNLLNVPKTYTNMKKIMQLVTSQITYENDKIDNWRPISDVLIFGYGDCDDSGGIALTSALGMAGWKDNEVFAWTGWYYPKGKSKDPNTKICHAWCIAKCNEKWYVLEGTNRVGIPKVWETVKDKYEGNLGGCNWKFEGIIENGKTYI